MTLAGACGHTGCRGPHVCARASNRCVLPMKPKSSSSALGVFARARLRPGLLFDARAGRIDAKADARASGKIDRAVEPCRCALSETDLQSMWPCDACVIAIRSPAKTGLITAAAAGTVQKLRIECRGNAAFSHRRRVARQGSRRHSRRHAGRAAHRLRRDHRTAQAASDRIRPRPAHGDRIRQSRDSVGCARGRDTRLSHLAAHPQQGLGKLAADDARRG